MKNSFNKISILKFFTVAGVPGYILLARPIIYALIARQRSFSEVATVDASAAIQIVVTTLAFIVGGYIFLKNSNHRKLLLKTPFRWFVFYLLWATITVLWSVIFSLTGYRAFENMAYLLLISAVLVKVYEKIGVEGLIDWVMKFAILTILASILQQVQLLGIGVLSIDTLLSEQMNSTPYFFLALLLPTGYFVKSFILPISIFSLSNTAYAGMAAGIFGLGRGSRKVKVFFGTILLATVGALLFYQPEIILKNTIFYGKEGVGLEYTTGRDQIFTIAVMEGLNNPLHGFGFVAGEEYIIRRTRPGVIGAHNGLLSAFLGTGIIGVFFFMIFLVGMIKVAKSNKIPSKYRGPFLCTTILIIIHTMGNPGLGTRVYGTWIPAVTIFSMISLIYLHFKKASSYENNMGHP
ncbi:hypothetical protein G3570_04815 [Balneolaceae bacterium YR4-1]|uniref:O-antigen ligase n=1 Tax=Halalkalibaculum roseum TaxID=2709311 RepID=A0A6M1SXS9_9BACT|nr:hypothetical protein [Halalkalibaculum roseum]NGP75944.1 hypothetical protein [Halalkalibaculum roseum]